MGKQIDFNELVAAVVDGESDDVVEFVEEALKNGIRADVVIEKGLVEGMRIVSDRYDKKEFFVPDLAAAADAMSEALELLNPLLQANANETKGTIVIGVVKECSQEIGKNIVSAMLSGGGYLVYDIGINVSPEKFVQKAKEVNANIIAMGSPMLQTVKYFKETAELLQKENLRNGIKLLIGGASTNEATVSETGVDAWAKDAREAVVQSDRLMGVFKKKGEEYNAFN